MKVCVAYSIIILGLCLSSYSMSLVSLNSIDKSFYIGYGFIFLSAIISYNLSIFTINSSEIQQQRYRYIWMFLFICAWNIVGIISILMLSNKIKTDNKVSTIMVQTQSFVKIEKWFLWWAMFSPIITMFLIIPIFLSIINLIKISKHWKKEQITMSELKKISYFSNDVFLMLTYRAYFFN